MKSNLEKAKELKEQWEHAKTCDCCWEVVLVLAKELSDEIKNGCGEKFWSDKISFFVLCAFRHLDEDGGAKEYCDDCQKAIKILEAIK